MPYDPYKPYESYERNPRSWPVSDRAPTRTTSRLLVGIVCAAVVFLLSSTLLVVLGLPHDVAAFLGPSTAAAPPTYTLSQVQPSTTAVGTNPTTSPITTSSPGKPDASPTPRPTAAFTATPTPTRTATPLPTATPSPATLGVTPTSVDAGSCSAPSTTAISVSNPGGSPMTWSLNTFGIASSSLSGDTLAPEGSDPVTITWTAPVASGSMIQFTANGSNPSVNVTVTCA